ncbi:MAG TPA: APC family permease [Candidatus Polarisedimenticolia bacterium]|nr:APC family permease [Candidatus Polarisedimenticolia bacterium]
MANERTAGPAPRKATAFQLVFMMYSVICSGAYGLEQMVSNSGPGMAILTLSILPIIWAVPLALACAELSALYPVEGGYYRWARMAFGDFVGYQAGWLVWLANLATNGTFAVLFANYARQWIPNMSTGVHWCIAASLVWLSTWMNYRGIRIVGGASVVLTILIFLPFLALTLLGILHWQFNPLVPFVTPEKGSVAAFGGGLLIAIWLYSGFEKLTTNAAEVEKPSRAFPIALAFAVPMTSLSYIIPTVAGLAAHGHWSEWGESYFSVVAGAIGGPLLGSAMAFGGLLSNLSLLMVTILGQSRLPMVMAEDRLFPAIFRKTHPRFGTPVAALLVGGVILSLIIQMNFEQLAGLFSLVQVCAYLLIYASLIRLRAHPPLPAAAAGIHPEEPAGHRPFRVPLGLGGLVAMTLPSVALSFLAIRQTFWHDGALDVRQAIVDLGVFASGPLTYFVFRRFVGNSPR